MIEIGNRALQEEEFYLDPKAGLDRLQKIQYFDELKDKYLQMVETFTRSVADPGLNKPLKFSEVFQLSVKDKEHLRPEYQNTFVTSEQRKLIKKHR